MRIYVWNVLVKTQGSEWFCIVYCEKSAELLGTVVRCCFTPEWALTPFVALTHCGHALTRAGQLENAGWWPGRSLGLLCASQEVFPTALALKWAPWCVPEPWSPWSPPQRCAVVGQEVRAYTPKGLPCLSLPSLPHCLTRGVFINCVQPLENRRAINSGEGENVWVWHVVCIPAFPNTQVNDQNCIQFSDSQMFCLGQVCC